MASPAEIMQPLPDTLPEDFSEWDGGFSPANVPVNSNPFTAAADHAVESAPPERPASPQIRVLAVMDGSTPAPPFTATDFYATHDDPSHSKRKALMRARMKRLVLTVATVTSILLLLVLVPLRYSRLRQRLASVKLSVVHASATPETVSAANQLKPSPATLLTKPSQPEASTLKLASSAPQPTQPATPAAAPATTVAEEETPQPAEPTMMNNQLAAPQRIPRDVNVVPKVEAPPSSGFGAAGIEGQGGGGGIGTVFGSSNKGPRVSAQIPAKINLSSGVAAGLLLQKTMPVYPAIAKSASVSGTVVLQATISKSGTIEKLRVITGPMVLRQAATDAVSTWRYRPYLIDGTPVEVDTSVSVVFTTPR